MPNHVYNTVTASGKTNIITLLEKAVENGKDQLFDFNRIIPKPAIVEILGSGHLDSNTRQANPNRNWYDWSVANWDTKWNAYDAEKNDVGVYSFTTAWSHPLCVIRTLSSLFPELTIEIEYQEEGDGFSGATLFRDGQVLKERYRA